MSVTEKCQLMESVSLESVSYWKVSVSEKCQFLKSVSYWKVSVTGKCRFLKSANLKCASFRQESVN